MRTRNEALNNMYIFMRAVQLKFIDEAKKMGFEPDNLVIRNGRMNGDWIILDRTGKNSNSVYCFIRVTDGHTKTLGELNAGDIHKPASFKAPAKHARGNLFENDYGLHCAGPYGIQYLK